MTHRTSPQETRRRRAALPARPQTPTRPRRSHRDLTRLLSWLEVGTNRAEARTLTRHLNRTRRPAAHRPYSVQALTERLADAHGTEAGTRRLSAQVLALHARTVSPEQLHDVAASLLQAYLSAAARARRSPEASGDDLAEHTRALCLDVLREAAALDAATRARCVLGLLLHQRAPHQARASAGALALSLDLADDKARSLTTRGRAAGSHPAPPPLCTGPAALVRALVAPGAPPLAAQPAAA